MTAAHWIFFLLGAFTASSAFTLAMWLAAGRQETEIRRRIADHQRKNTPPTNNP